MPTIVTVHLDAASQAAFDRMREAHYPPHLNRIGAHLTLFHALPDTDEIRATLVETARLTGAFEMQVSGVMSLGRGVAYAIASSRLMSTHASLASAFKEHLIPQDKQKFRPHIVVQNKVSGADAKALFAQLTSDFNPSQIGAQGLEWWDYLGGPWKLRETFRFAD